MQPKDAAQQLMLEHWGEVMRSPSGRYVVAMILRDCGIDTIPHSVSSKHHSTYLVGRQSVALNLLEFLKLQFPKEYISMQLEELEKNINDRNNARNSSNGNNASDGWSS